MNELQAALAAVPFLRTLNEADIARLARRVEVREFPAGSVVLTEGDPCAGRGVVVSGEVRVVRSSVEGREQVLRILGPGRSFNDVAAVDGGPNPGSVVASLPATVALLPHRAFLRLLDDHPLLARAVLELVAQRLRSVVEIVEDSALHSVVGRVARVLLRCADGERALMEGAPDACEHITQEDIAAMTGSVREVVQRALKHLEQEGAIELGRAEVHITDPATLRRAAQS